MKTRSLRQKITQVISSPKSKKSLSKKQSKPQNMSQTQTCQQTPFSDSTVYENGQLIIGIKKRVIVKHHKQHFTKNYKIITFQKRNANANPNIPRQFICFYEKELGMERISNILKIHNCDNDMDTDSEQIENVTNSMMADLRSCIKKEKQTKTIIIKRSKI